MIVLYWKAPRVFGDRYTHTPIADASRVECLQLANNESVWIVPGTPGWDA